MIEHVYTIDRGHYTRRAPSKHPASPKLPGVKYDRTKPAKPWKAKIVIGGKERYLGRYKTPEEASAAYKAARKICPAKPPGRPKKQPPHRTLDDYPDMISEAAHDHPAAMLLVI